ncbi:hypothetical protein D3P07_04595 [Paenibacillus sp. 1011MAR3C5]|uniref:hypothetical protein n=1 Tax=Paenibacillus sp. 1011MAR3C5 TaxID=1675787 RepID=UPI000E6CB40E|nr:hypothetical protein [Paenibacillus sp. 1011MAR3C5]RJE91334.1 hypothetical protein D3P07_04595 [Paenibacillus sp. 1011MAR3C5]
MNILRSVGYAACLTGLLLAVISCSRPEVAVPTLTEPSLSPISTAASIQYPVSSQTPASAAVAGLSLPLKLELQRKDTEDGFSLEYESSDIARIHVSQTWISPEVEEMSYGVHVVTTYRSGDANQSAVQQDAVVVNPRTGQYITYPLYYFTYRDEPDYSLAEGYGFTDDRYFVYIAMWNHSEIEMGYRYEVVKMDILTGEKIVISNQPDHLERIDMYAHCWMNEAGDGLFLNSFGGTLLRIDLDTGESVVNSEEIKHSWPFFLTSIAPDGERFWHTSLEDQAFRLYQADGEPLRDIPFGDNYMFDHILWSVKGQYAYQDYTSQNSDIVERRNNSEFKEIAAESIMIYDQDGKEVEVISARTKDRYVELAGWVSDDAGLEYALIHTYSWKPNEEGEDLYGVLGNQTNSAFSLYDPRRDAYQSLKVTKDKTLLKHPHAAMHDYGPIYAVDIKDGYIIEVTSEGYWVDSGNTDELVWVAADVENGRSYSVQVWNKQPEDGSSAYEALDLRAYKATEGKLLSRDDIRYVTIQ